MPQNLEIYNTMDWWNPHNPLFLMSSFKFNYFREKIIPIEGSHVLDVGCGGGILAEKFTKQGAHVTGIDLSKGALQTARDHAVAGSLEIRYELGKAEDIPFADGIFDAVVCADCLEHVDDLKRVIGQVNRVLKDGGVFCYSTHNRSLWSKVLIAWVLNWYLPLANRSLNVSEQVHDWKKFIKPKELIELMAHHGLFNGEIKGILGFKVLGKPWISYIGYATKRQPFLK